jgi:hypothetical protein
MTSIDRTAYPRFGRLVTARELVEVTLLGRPHSRRRWALVATTVIASLGSGLGTCGSSSKIGHYLSCALATKSYLPLSDFGQFFDLGGGTSAEADWRGLMGPGGKVPLWVSEFKRSRVTAAMARRALEPPFIEQENAKKAKLHVPGPWPPSPLSGLIVEKTPGLLEVDQVHAVYTSPAGGLALSATLRADRGGLGGYATANARAPRVMPGAVVTYDIVGVYPAPDDENRVLVGIEYGPVLAQFSFQGGKGVDQELVAPLVVKAAARLAEACNGRGP